MVFATAMNQATGMGHSAIQNLRLVKRVSIIISVLQKNIYIVTQKAQNVCVIISHDSGTLHLAF